MAMQRKSNKLIRCRLSAQILTVTSPPADDDPNWRFGCLAFLDNFGSNSFLRSNNDLVPYFSESRFEGIAAKCVAYFRYRNYEAKKTGFSAEVTAKPYSNTLFIACSVKRKDYSSFKAQWLVEGLTIVLPTLMVDAIADEVFFRGAVALGEFYQTDRMLMGAAFFDISDYYQRPEWIGISAAPSLHYALNHSFGNQDEFLKQYVKYDIPLISGTEKDGMALNWTVQQVEVDKDFSEKMKIAYKVMNEQLHTVDPTMSLKWRNTSQFYEYVKALQNK